MSKSWPREKNGISVSGSGNSAMKAEHQEPETVGVEEGTLKNSNSPVAGEEAQVVEGGGKGQHRKAGRDQPAFEGPWWDLDHIPRVTRSL